MQHANQCIPTPLRPRLKLVVEARCPLQRSGLMTHFVHTRELRNSRSARHRGKYGDPVPDFGCRVVALLEVGLCAGYLTVVTAPAEGAAIPAPQRRWVLTVAVHRQREHDVFAGMEMVGVEQVLAAVGQPADRASALASLQSLEAAGCVGDKRDAFGPPPLFRPSS